MECDKKGSNGYGLKKNLSIFSNSLCIICLIAVCAIFSLNFVSSLIILFDKNLIKEGLEIFGLIVSNIATLSLMCVIFLYYDNSYSRKQIGVLRAFDNTIVISENAVEKANDGMLFAVVTFLIEEIAYFTLFGPYRMPDVLIWKTVVINCNLTVLILSCIFAFISIIALVNARLEIKSNYERMFLWERTLKQIDEICFEQAKRAVSEKVNVEKFSSEIFKMVDEIPEVPIFEREKSLLYCYAMFRSNECYKSRKWIYRWGAKFAPLFFCLHL